MGPVASELYERQHILLIAYTLPSHLIIPHLHVFLSRDATRSSSLEYFVDCGQTYNLLPVVAASEGAWIGAVGASSFGAAGGIRGRDVLGHGSSGGNGRKEERDECKLHLEWVEGSTSL